MLHHQDVPVLRDHPHRLWEAATQKKALAIKALGYVGVGVLFAGFFQLDRGLLGVVLVIAGGALAAWSTRLQNRYDNSKPSLEVPLSDRDQIQLNNWVIAKGGQDAAQFVGYKFGQATYDNVPYRILTVQQGLSKGQFTPPSDR